MVGVVSSPIPPILHVSMENVNTCLAYLSSDFFIYFQLRQVNHRLEG